MKPDVSLVIGYHRPPISWSATGGWRKPSSPNGILPILTRLFSTGTLSGIWVTSAVFDLGDHPRIHDHGTGIPLSFVELPWQLWAAYFHRTCKDALWPVLMSQPWRMRFDPAHWMHYRMVNALFARHIDTIAGPNAIVWLHDYNLWLVPGLLARTRPDLRVGLFHHTPFPPPHIFDALPVADEIRASLQCLDWAGFQTAGYAEQFGRMLADAPQLPKIGVHPLEIDRGAVESVARARAAFVTDPTTALVLSVERLDYTKAPLEKVAAFATLLARQPNLRRRVVFRLICPAPEPGITAYESTRRALEQRIDEINRSYGMAGWQPIDYLDQPLSFTEVVDQYLAADVFWIASLQDGMNLTAKEFVAAKVAADRSGALVLSRHTGVAEQLGAAAVLTDPHSHEDLVDKLHRSLEMPASQRRTRLRGMSRLIGHRGPASWATDIIAEIKAVG